VDFNPAYFRQLGTSPEVTALVMEAGEKIAGIARASAPVASGEYRAGIIVRLVRNKNLVNLSVVEATDPKSMAVESRTGNLARAAGRSRG
jgi:hypothetical protein